MRSRFGNAARMAILAAVAASPALAQAQPKKDACLAKWEERAGPLAESKPSRLAGFREMRSADGNALYLDKTCAKAFVGAVVEWSQAESPRGVERIDRAGLDYAGLASVGPAKPAESWIFATSPEGLELLERALKDRPAWERQEFYVAVLSASAPPCALAKMDARGLAKDCASSAAMALALAGRQGAFAVDRSGARVPAPSWEDFFAGLDKKKGAGKLPFPKRKRG